VNGKAPANHEKHQGEEDNGEFADPQFCAEEIEALAGNVETHCVKQRKQDKGNNADRLDRLAHSMELRTLKSDPRGIHGARNISGICRDLRSFRWNPYSALNCVLRGGDAEQLRLDRHFENPRKPRG
jgi:hypothetical protein